MPEVRIPFPLGGLQRRIAYQDSDIQSCAHAVNVFPDDSRLNRTRGGSRNGLVKRFQGNINGAPGFMKVISLSGVISNTYQVIVVATDTDVFYTETATSVNVNGMVSYIESLTVTSGDLLTEGGDVLLAENADTLLIGDVSFDTPSQQLSTSYQGGLVVVDGSGDLLKMTFNPATITEITISAGTLPSSPETLSSYRDRLVITSGRNWYMSRQGVPGDWDYSADADDAAGAVAGAASDAGEPGEPIIAVVAGGFDYLVFFAEDSTWLLRGDPRYGGELSNLSRSLGCVGSLAWCYGEFGEIYFLSKSGLCVLAPEMNEPPRQLSVGKLPIDMRRVDRFSYNVNIAYDQVLRCVCIFITPLTDISGNHWLYDIDTDSFWEMTFANNGHQPYFAFGFSGTPDRENRILMACADGYLRQFGGTDDDGEVIQSSIVLGPYPLADTMSASGIINELLVAFSETSGSVDIKVYVDDTAQAVIERATADSSADAEYSMVSGRSFTKRPRKRGVSFALRFDSNSPWSFEVMTAVTEVVGRKR